MEYGDDEGARGAIDAFVWRLQENLITRISDNDNDNDATQQTNDDSRFDVRWSHRI